jgi:tetratricopeptide (TPR) repeat protein
MLTTPGKIAALCVVASLSFTSSPLKAQGPKSTGTPAAAGGLTVEKAMEVAEQGRCKEALSTLKRAMTVPADADIKKKMGVLGLRCALDLDERDTALDFVRQLHKLFPKDPDVLFIIVHAYSDLSTRTAQDLGRMAPQSIAAHKLNAEALEMQGKWGDAESEYESMIAREPNAPGLHFLLGRSLLSRPDADAKSTERAKQEFQKELEIDPKNAGAHYVLGELARREAKWEEAVAQFSQAAKLDPNFAEAYLGWGSSLVSLQRYEDSIAPLRAAERLTPGNPQVHYTLGTALSRLGQKEEADKEFAIQSSLMNRTPTSPAADKPQ